MYNVRSSKITNIIIILTCFCSSYACLKLNTASKLINLYKNNEMEEDPVTNDAYLNITELVKKYGYDIEEHTVVTADGYILSLHRISSGRNMKKNNTPILLMHGILDSSDSWVLQGPNSALAYTLSDQGYDVWMGNARGNKYSSTHVTLDNENSTFWNFSWEEIGIYDLPTMIDYILNTTEKGDLYYVGHSQGTTVFFVLLALKPEYNPKVKMMFTLAPIAWIHHAKSPIVKMFTPVYGALGYFSSNINKYSSSIDFFINMPTFFCYILPLGCHNVLQWIIGNDYKYINSSLLPVIYEHVPSGGSSTLQFIHFGQMYQSGRFCRFDHGARENFLKYGQNVAPNYDLSNAKVPVVLFYSTNDWLSDVADVGRLYNELPNVYDSYNIDSFNHVDYMYASVAKDLIYLTINKIIKEFEMSVNKIKT